MTNDQRVYRLLLFARSKVRLQARPEDDPMTWRFPMELDGRAAFVVIRDVVSEDERHRLRAAHTGVIGDYVAWLTLGAALFGGGVALAVA